MTRSENVQRPVALGFGGGKWLVMFFLSSVQLHGTLRVVMEPLLGDMPLVGALSVFFLKKPVSTSSCMNQLLYRCIPSLWPLSSFLCLNTFYLFRFKAQILVLTIKSLRGRYKVLPFPLKLCCILWSISWNAFEWKVFIPSPTVQQWEQIKRTWSNVERGAGFGLDLDFCAEGTSSAVLFRGCFLYLDGVCWQTSLEVLFFTRSRVAPNLKF